MKRFITCIALIFSLANAQVMQQGIVATKAPSSASTSWFVSLGSPADASGSGYCLGEKITTDGSTHVLTHLGLYNISGNTLAHNVYLLDASGNHLRNASVATSGQPTGILYSSVSNYTLAASTTYILMADYSPGGDHYNDPLGVTTTSAAAWVDGGYHAGDCSADPLTGITFVGSGAGGGYGPLSFKYQ